MRPHNPPPAVYAFEYERPPISGNAINGLGEQTKRHARQVFHSSGRGPGREPIAWAALDTFFNLISEPGPFWQVVLTIWQRRLYAGSVARERIPVEDPRAVAQQIKAKALQIGAHLVGISKIGEDALYEGESVPYKYAISLGTAMDRDEMLHVPQVRAATEVMRMYRIGSRTAIRLAAYIRSLGWPAQAYADGEDVLQIPLALQAGLGQLGKHGSVISKEYGSNFRLAAIFTDMPLACDEPADIGVDDVCATCQRCVLDCPPDAIFREKQLVRGEVKWYVDFDKCIPYFAKTAGCGICIEVCPWSEPGQGQWLSEKMLAKRQN